jgi:hypothetical protein
MFSVLVGFLFGVPARFLAAFFANALPFKLFVPDMPTLVSVNLFLPVLFVSTCLAYLNQISLLFCGQNFLKPVPALLKAITSWWITTLSSVVGLATYLLPRHAPEPPATHAEMYPSSFTLRYVLFLVFFWAPLLAIEIIGICFLAKLGRLVLSFFVTNPPKVSTEVNQF